MEYLPPSSPSRQDISQEKPTISMPPFQKKQPPPSRTRKRSCSAVGWIFWAILFAAVGFGTGYLLLPHVSADAVTQAVIAHLPHTDTPLSAVFLRLLAPCIPIGLLLFSAALTGFSSTLISLVLCLRGLIEGFTLSAIVAIVSGAIPCPAVFSQNHLLLFFSLWTALRWGIRLYLAVSARRTATQYFSAFHENPKDAKPLVMRHLAHSLGAFLVAAAGCLIYGICLLHFV